MSETGNFGSWANGAKYTISTQQATYNNDAIEAALITDIIEDLYPESNDFIVILPDAPVGGSLYMQAIPGDTPSSTIVEIRLSFADQPFKHYNYQTADRSQVIRMFLDYWGQQKLPALDQWTDITDQFINPASGHWG
ncbi:hypothetical protein [Paenibacillus donghaensis]|nr:hypothetical protein [Paenibacillus donghaensis]